MVRSMTGQCSEMLAEGSAGGGIAMVWFTSMEPVVFSSLYPKLQLEPRGDRAVGVCPARLRGKELVSFIEGPAEDQVKSGASVMVAMLVGQ